MEEKQKEVTPSENKTSSVVMPSPSSNGSSAGMKPLVNPLSSKKFNKNVPLMVIGAVVVVLAGVATGWLMAGNKESLSSTTSGSQKTSANGQVTEAGMGDTSSYQSTVEGILKEGGIKGEGTHYIDRGLGESKYVYLTSSVVDLDTFVDKKVQVWGDTISAKYASWLIDVGKIKVIE